jgi:hypothetical protein
MTDDFDPSAHYRWWYTCTRTGKRLKTSFHATQADMVNSSDDMRAGPFEPDLASKEVRHRVGGASEIGRERPH